MLTTLLLLGIPATIMAGVWPAISHRLGGGRPFGTWLINFVCQLIVGELLIIFLMLVFSQAPAQAEAEALSVILAVPVILVSSLVSTALVLIGIKPRADDA